MLPRDSRLLVFGVGLTTFVLGFLVGAVFNVYLIAVHAPLAQHFRTALTYRSAILGDGLLLPFVNMTAASFLNRERRLICRNTLLLALVLGALVTAAFHIIQASNQLVNWAMPVAWHWNALGVWHAGYMLAVTSLLWLFMLVLLKVVGRGADVPREAMVVLLGVLVFLALLRLDYPSVDLAWWLPAR